MYAVGNHLTPLDVALYAMDKLTEKERVKIESHMCECIKCRTEVHIENFDLKFYNEIIHDVERRARQN